MIVATHQAFNREGRIEIDESVTPVQFKYSDTPLVQPKGMPGYIGEQTLEFPKNWESSTSMEHPCFNWHHTLVNELVFKPFDWEWMDETRTIGEVLPILEQEFRAEQRLGAVLQLKRLPKAELEKLQEFFIYNGGVEAVIQTYQNEKISLLIGATTPLANRVPSDVWRTIIQELANQDRTSLAADLLYLLPRLKDVSPLKILMLDEAFQARASASSVQFVAPGVMGKKGPAKPQVLDELSRETICFLIELMKGEPLARCVATVEERFKR